MAQYTFSALASEDIFEIVEYTTDMWGEEQANRYLDGIYACCETIIKSPRIGRVYQRPQKEYRRMECGKHVIFYRLIEENILIVRILHQSMKPDKHSMEE